MANSTTWFFQMKQALQPFYLSHEPPYVCWLQGSIAPAVWDIKTMERKPQMVIIGNKEPTLKDWSDAGVLGRGMSNHLTLPMLDGYMILDAGFNKNGPWGVIVKQTTDALTLGFPSSLKVWREGVITLR